MLTSPIYRHAHIQPAGGSYGTGCLLNKGALGWDFLFMLAFFLYRRRGKTVKLLFGHREAFGAAVQATKKREQKEEAAAAAARWRGAQPPVVQPKAPAGMPGPEEFSRFILELWGAGPLAASNILAFIVLEFLHKGEVDLQQLGEDKGVELLEYLLVDLRSRHSRMRKKGNQMPQRGQPRDAIGTGRESREKARTSKTVGTTGRRGNKNQKGRKVKKEKRTGGRRIRRR